MKYKFKDGDIVLFCGERHVVRSLSHNQALSLGANHTLGEDKSGIWIGINYRLQRGDGVLTPNGTMATLVRRQVKKNKPQE